MGNDVRNFFIKDKPAFIDVSKSLARNQPNFIVLDICVFENFILAAEKWLVKGLSIS